jgi:hypothetical protein
MPTPIETLQSAATAAKVAGVKAMEAGSRSEGVRLLLEAANHRKAIRVLTAYERCEETALNDERWLRTLREAVINAEAAPERRIEDSDGELVSARAGAAMGCEDE